MQLLIFPLDIGILSFYKKLSIITKLNTTISIYGLNFDYFEKLSVIGIVINNKLAEQTEKKTSHDFKKQLQSFKYGMELRNKLKVYSCAGYVVWGKEIK